MFQQRHFMIFGGSAHGFGSMGGVGADTEA